MGQGLVSLFKIDNVSNYNCSKNISAFYLGELYHSTSLGPGIEMLNV